MLIDQWLHNGRMGPPIRREPVQVPVTAPKGINLALIHKAHRGRVVAALLHLLIGIDPAVMVKITIGQARPKRFAVNAPETEGIAIRFDLFIIPDDAVLLLVPSKIYPVSPERPVKMKPPKTQGINLHMVEVIPHPKLELEQIAFMDDFIALKVKGPVSLAFLQG